MTNLGKPIFTAQLNNRSITQQGQGEINIISDQNLPVIEIIVPEGVARTGPGSDYSRLTPLPQGTKGSRVVVSMLQSSKSITHDRRNDSNRRSESHGNQDHNEGNLGRSLGF